MKKSKKLVLYLLIINFVMLSVIPLHAKKPGSQGSNFAMMSWFAGGLGAAIGGACLMLEPCGVGVAGGGFLLGAVGGLSGGMYEFGPPLPSDPMPGDVFTGNQPAGACDLNCQASKPTVSNAPSPQPSVFQQLTPDMNGARLTVTLPPTHPVRNAITSLIPRPDWRGTAVTALQDNVLAPRYRRVPTVVRPHVRH